MQAITQYTLISILGNFFGSNGMIKFNINVMF